MANKTQLANNAWEALLTAHASLMKGFASEEIWDDLSMREYDVLYTLSKHREPINVTALNREVLLSQPALSRMVDRLVGRGLVERNTDSIDGRSVRLSLTDEGKTCQRQIGRKHARHVAHALTKLDTHELETLQVICTKLNRLNTEEA